MVRLVVLMSICFGACLSQNTGNFATISKDLRNLFSNSYSSVAWTSDTTFSTEGYPHYKVECDGTPNTATAQSSSVTIQNHQTVSLDSWCLPMGAIGYALNGVAIFNAASAENEDAFTAEGQTFDGCGAHSEMRGNYHYHIMPGSTCPKTNGSLYCFPQEKVPHWQSDAGDKTIVLGFALDGFPIFATLKNGQVQSEPGVDECGGKNYYSNLYAYFVLPTFPYFLGCFKGTNIQSSNRNAGNLGKCATGMTRGHLCYCKMGSTARNDECLPAKGASSCEAGQDVNCNLSGKCLSWKPGPDESGGNTDTGSDNNNNNNVQQPWEQQQWGQQRPQQQQGQQQWGQHQGRQPKRKMPRRPRKLGVLEILKELMDLEE